MPENETKLRIASYNIRKALGTDRRRDPYRVLRVIAALEADIVVLQEADRRIAPRHAALPVAEIADVTGLVPLALAQNAVSLGWHGNAILARAGIGVDQIAHVDLPGLEPRGAVRATLRAANQTFCVTGVHLALMRRYRKFQLDTLLERMAEETHLPQIMAGDFNEWSVTRGLGRLSRKLDIHALGNSFHARRNLAPLDRIAVSAEVAVLDGGMLTTPEARLASDHLPIWLDVVLRGAG